MAGVNLLRGVGERRLFISRRIDIDRRERRRGAGPGDDPPTRRCAVPPGAGGQPSQRVPARRGGVDPEGDRWRIRLAGGVPLVAEVTPAAAAEFRLADGGEVFAVVKATEVDVYPI